MPTPSRVPFSQIRNQSLPGDDEITYVAKQPSHDGKILQEEA
jgi:hypothetical protein